MSPGVFTPGAVATFTPRASENIGPVTPFASGCVESTVAGGVGSDAVGSNTVDSETVGSDTVGALDGDDVAGADVADDATVDAGASVAGRVVELASRAGTAVSNDGAETRLESSEHAATESARAISNPAVIRLVTSGPSTAVGWREGYPSTLIAARAERRTSQLWGGGPARSERRPTFGSAVAMRAP